MKKFLLIAFVNFFIVFSFTAQDFIGTSYSEHYGISILIDSDIITITNYDYSGKDNHEVFSTNIEIKNEFGLTFIYLNENYHNIEKLLALYSEELLLLYDSDDDSPWFLGVKSSLPGAPTEGINTWSNFYPDTSSYYVETNRQYKQSNLLSFNTFNPWVEGAKGNGIGEYVVFDQKAGSPYLNQLIISNGFVSYDKPYLYERNNRIKTLRIHSADFSIDIYVELEDNPNLQFVDLNQFKTNENLFFEIFEVYSGTHYQDTCINFIVPAGTGLK